MTKNRIGEQPSSDILDFLDEACRSLSGVGQSLGGLLEDLSTPPACIAALNPEIDRLEQETTSLRHNLLTVLQSLQVQEKDNCSGMADRLAELQRENEKTHAQLAVVQGEAARLRTQLQHQSAFCASLGAVLGNLVWKASRVPPVVELLLSGNKVADFLCIVSGTLESFLETFDTVMPGPTADESQFIMAMGGIVTNMAAAPTGRQFLVSDPTGRDLIFQIIKILPVIPTPSGNCLKRLLLMALYNISINQAGLDLLQEEGKGTIFSVTADCLRSQSNELCEMALKLLHSLTSEINDPALITWVPTDLIAGILNSEDSELQKMAQDVINNVNTAKKRIKQGQTERQPPPGSEPKAEREKSSQPTAAWKLPSHT